MAPYPTGIGSSPWRPGSGNAIRRCGQAQPRSAIMDPFFIFAIICVVLYVTVLIVAAIAEHERRKSNRSLQGRQNDRPDKK